MYTKDAIRYSLKLADQATMRSLATIEDAPLTFPTENGGCHPLWVMGHLAFVEGLTHELLGGGGNPVAHWAVIFGQDTVPTADATQYPLFATVRDQYVQLRSRNLQLLESMTRGGPRQADALAAHRSRGALRDVRKGSVDDCDASDGASRADHGRGKGGGPRDARFDGARPPSALGGMTTPRCGPAWGEVRSSPRLETLDRYCGSDAGGTTDKVHRWVTELRQHPIR